VISGRMDGVRQEGEARHEARQGLILGVSWKLRTTVGVEQQ
jgi:hypothetical protein